MKHASRAPAGVVLSVMAALLLAPAFGRLAPASDDALRIAVSAPQDETSAQAESGSARIVLDARARKLAGIVSAAPETVTVTPQISASGEVADLAPLVVDHQRVTGARTVLAARRDTARALEDRLQQLRSLGRDGEIVAARERAALEVSWRTERERVAAARAELDRATGELRMRWGKSLEAALQDGAERVASLLAGDAQLVVFAMPSGEPDPAPGEAVSVVAPSRGSAATAGIVVGPAPASLGHAAGATHYAHTRGAALRAGMRVTVRVPRTDTPVTGVWLPAGAVVWHAGARWYFVEVATHTFERVRVSETLEHGSGVVLEAAAASRGPVVIRGAQALLAEAFRAQIPEEDED